MARLEGLEPPTYRFEVCRSIQLSYRRAGKVYRVEGLIGTPIANPLPSKLAYGRKRIIRPHPFQLGKPCLPQIIACLTQTLQQYPHCTIRSFS